MAVKPWTTVVWQPGGHLFCTLFPIIFWVKVSKVDKTKVFWRGVNVLVSRMVRVGCSKRCNLGADKLPCSVAFRICESEFIGPTVIAASIVRDCKACARDRQTGERIPKDASAIFAIGRLIVLSSDRKLVIRIPN